MRVHWILSAILSGTPFVAQAQTRVPASPGQLVAEVVYNELHDHQLHGYWRYWIEKHAQKQSKLEEQVETADGPITRLLSTGGRPLSAADEESERARLDHWLNSPQEQERHRQDYADDEKRIGRILALLPQAFLFADGGTEKGCVHLRFWPNPAYPPHSIEARIFHAMRGEMWSRPPRQTAGAARRATRRERRFRVRHPGAALQGRVVSPATHRGQRDRLEDRTA